MTIQTRTLSVQEVQEKLPALLLEMVRSRKERVVIEQEGTPVAMLVAAERHEEERREHPHIGRVEGVCGGEPIILGTRISVARVIELFKDSGSVDEIMEALPLSPAQVYGALSYYYDNQEEIEQALEERRLESVLKRHNLVLKEVVEGVYEAHDADGRW